jgi:hypothetical protein
MKTKEEIIEHLKFGLDRGMHKFYFNALLFALGREDLIPKTYTEKAKKKVMEELEK